MSATIRGRAFGLVLFGSLWGCLSGCLEGDPNPYLDGGASGTQSGASGRPSEITPSGECSKTSSESIVLEFVNRSPEITLNLLWVDFGCAERAYGTISPGAKLTQNTFVSHPWRLRDAATNTLYREIIPVSGGPTVVEFP